ncbi:cobalt ABC transporter permease [Rhodopseudomonas palustris]|uniref:Cobalt ABC transporter permease n=2 Tax=Nitrobacteraceae TaxID=41294 RepID=A0A0D7F2F7_RHOPL|nr:cobalt ABC transporter permease [Rhodopseudomonas palustris]
MTKTIASVLLALLIACGACVPALAHKVVAGAYASGDRIEGEIGFSDGSMAKNALVEVLAEDGGKLGETHTAEDGTFVFTPTKRVVHIFHADLGGGHVANIRLEVSDLPATLKASGTDKAPAAAVTSAAKTAEAAAGGISDAQRAALVEAVRNEVKPLRREIIALKEKNDLQSILGGIGYIGGLFGLWFFLAARRQQKRAA